MSTATQEKTATEPKSDYVGAFSVHYKSKMTVQEDDGQMEISNGMSCVSNGNLKIYASHAIVITPRGTYRIHLSEVESILTLDSEILF